MGATQASISGASQLRLSPVAGVQRHSVRAGISTQYSACSAPCQTGLSPVPLRASSTSSALMKSLLMLVQPPNGPATTKPPPWYWATGSFRSGLVVRA